MLFENEIICVIYNILKRELCDRICRDSTHSNHNLNFDEQNIENHENIELLIFEMKF